MKRAIIVRGNPGVGKSTILIAIYNWIKSTYTPTVVRESIWTGDLFGVLEIGKLKIGLCSAGDEEDGVRDFINDCKAEQCDIIIGACRRRGGTYNVVRADLVYPHYVTEWCDPEGISPTNMSLRISIAIDEIKARLIGLEKI